MFSFITNLVTRKKDQKSSNESSEKSTELDVNKIIQATDTNNEINKETGLPFTQVELVRNYLLNSLSPDLKAELYKRCWENIENNTKKSNKSYLYDFIKYYITIKAQDTISEYKLNQEFREHIKINNENNKAILEELLALSKVYPYILSPKDSNIDEDIKTEIEFIKELKVTDAYPLMLIFLKDYYNKNLSKDDLLELLLFIQTIIVRRYVVNGLTTNMLPKIYTSLIKQTTNANYSKILFKAAFSMTGYSRVPDNEEFVDGINTNKYKTDSVTKYILKRLERDNVLDPSITQNKQNLSAQKILFAGKNDIIEDIETLKASLTQSFLKVWHVPFNDNSIVSDVKDIEDTTSDGSTIVDTKLSSDSDTEKNLETQDISISIDEKSIEKDTDNSCNSGQIFAIKDFDPNMSKGVKFDYIEIDGHRLNSDHKGSAVSMYVAFANYFLDQCGEDKFLEQYGWILNVSKDKSKLSNAFALRDGIFIEIRVANTDKIKAIKKILTKLDLLDKSFIKTR